MSDAQQAIGLAVAACTLLIIFGGWWRWVRPRYKGAKDQAVSIRDAIIGRPAIKDSITGREISPKLPGIGERVDTLELVVLRVSDQSRTLAEHDARHAEHEQRLTALEDARVERVVSQAESAAMWTAVVQERDGD